MAHWTDRKRVWTPTEIASELHCTRATVYNWCVSGVLRATRTAGGEKQSGHFRVTADDLRAFLCLAPRQAA